MSRSYVPISEPLGSLRLLMAQEVYTGFSKVFEVDLGEQTRASSASIVITLYFLEPE